MNPEVYLEYLRQKKQIASEKLHAKMILSFMPMGLEASVWDAGVSEKFFLGRIRHLSGQVEVLSSFGIGGPAARTHLGLAIAAGVASDSAGN